MNRTLISIIVPVYNVESYLKFCIDSLISQTYKNIEIILVNDGSTDRSKKICEDYANQDNRIILINQKNKGLSGARNTGVKNCNGEYLTFVDSDDYIDKDYIECLYNMIDSNIKISMCQLDVATNYNTKNNICDNYDKAVISKRNFFLNSLSDNRYLSSCGKLFHISLFDNVIFPEGKLHEDIYVLGEIISKVDYIAFINNKKYFYIKRGNSITTNRFNEKKFDLIEAANRYTSIILEHYPDLYNNTIVFRNHQISSLVKQMSYDDYKKYNFFIKKLINSSRKNLKIVISDNTIPLNEKLLMIVDCTNYILIKLFWKIFEVKKFLVK